MILSSPDDFSTNDVIDWLRYYNIPFLRISINDIIKYKSVTINDSEFNIEFLVNENNYSLNDFNIIGGKKVATTINGGKADCYDYDTDKTGSVDGAGTPRDFYYTAC